MLSVSPLQNVTVNLLETNIRMLCWQHNQYCNTCSLQNLTVDLIETTIRVLGGLQSTSVLSGGVATGENICFLFAGCRM